MMRLLLTCVSCCLALNALAGPAGPVTWGATANVAGGGWGRMVQLTNGNWLAVSTIFPVGTNSYLALYRSTDTCRTWSFLSQVKEAGRTLDNGELVVMPDGTVRLTMRSLISGASYRLPVYTSGNGGQSWAYLSNIDTSEGLGSRGLWEPDFWVLDDGRLVVTYSNEKHNGYSQVISERVSQDGGASWSAETWAVAQPGGGSLRPGMSQMTRMTDGRYLLAFELVGVGNADVYCKISDDGLTWPAGFGSRIPCHHCGPFVTTLSDGRLLVTSCENQVSFSDDFGETWQKIDPPAWNLGYAFSWPAVYGLTPDEVGVMAVAPSVRLRFGELLPPQVWLNPFSADFTGDTDPGWSRYGGNISLSGGRYVFDNVGTYGKAMTGDNFWRDGVLEADVFLSTAGDAGLMFRTTNPDYVGPDDAFGYYAGLRLGGSVFLGRMSNSWTQLISVPLPVQSNTWYRLGVKMEGSAISVYVDDPITPKFTFSDASFSRGQIGVRSYMCNAQFDNVTFSNTSPLRLNWRADDGEMELAWPQTSWPVELQETTELDVPSSWLPTAMPASMSNGHWQLSISTTGSPWRFFRLRGP